MRTVHVAELKNQLSSFLHRVRAGEELLVRDRNIPIAKIVPFPADEIELDELSLVASGQMILPKKQFDENRFWRIGAHCRTNRKVEKAIRRALEAEREESNAGVLGHKRDSSPLRARSGH